MINFEFKMAGFWWDAYETAKAHKVTQRRWYDFNWRDLEWMPIETTKAQIEHQGTIFVWRR